MKLQKLSVQKMHNPLNNFFYLVFKRIGDVILSLLVLILLSPLLLIVFILLRTSQGSGVFFQDRPGKNGKIFRLVKFKTMTDERDENGNLLPDSQRLTKIGNVVRSTSLDELPQLINVLKGDMSLVGPRPLLVKYLPLYNERQARRHDVKPGITGWAQVNGRNAISWKERFELDLYYVDNRCFMLDIKILLLTIKKVYNREGVNATKNTTMETFVGEE